MARTLAPLVSIGVPTYDRPEGLRRTLSCLSNQTYPHLDILVSDNCSPGSATANVLAEMAERDPRIRFVRQPAPLRVAENFRYVLRESGADYFMWAADDDEWRPAFIERCIGAMRDGAVSAMSGFEIAYRSSGRVVHGRMPAFDPRRGAAPNMSAFLRRLTPSLIYGLHRRSAIDFFLKEEFFDYFDCYFILRLLSYGGIALVPDRLYVAGVDAGEYVVKPTGQSWGSGLRYLPFYRAARRVVVEAQISETERIELEVLLAAVVTRLFFINEMRAIRKRIWR